MTKHKRRLDSAGRRNDREGISAKALILNGIHELVKVNKSGQSVNHE